MKDVQIWAEGFRTPTTKAKATLLATVEANDFNDACKRLVKENETFARHYDIRNHTFWGCKIFATENKARGRFG